MDEWRKIQRENFTSLVKLCDYLELDLANRKKILTDSSFVLNLPRRLASKIEKNNIDDPLFRQFVPLIQEAMLYDDFSFDPVGDIKSAKSPKCLQKYAARSLFLPTSACAMHCRFCFRKHFPYDVSKEDFTKEISLIEEDKGIQEVILSGGDPLSLSDQALEKLILRLSKIKHLKRLRFHTRFPIGIPERIDSGFLALLESCPMQVWFLIHCNHAAELDDDVVASLKKVQKLGVPVLSQTVLLKGVNDNVKILAELFEKMVNAGIVPYYLHQLDRVQGAGHFEVSEDKGKALLDELRKQTSGYAIPRYVKEIAGEPSKRAIY